MSSKLTGDLESLKMNFKKSNAVVQHTELSLTVKYSDQGAIRFDLKPVTIGDALTQVDIENSNV